MNVEPSAVVLVGRSSWSLGSVLALAFTLDAPAELQDRVSRLDRLEQGFAHDRVSHLYLGRVGQDQLR
jgi:hypothetical protein